MLSADGVALGVSAGAEDEVLVDGLLPASSLPPQAAVAKSNDTAAAEIVTRLRVFDMVKLSFAEWKPEPPPANRSRHRYFGALSGADGSGAELFPYGAVRAP
ncbi:hypothetical protein GCM10027269_35100 [Kribbella endophytica]